MQITIDLTGFLAIWGAVLSTIAIGWDVYKWRTAGPNLQIRVATNMEPYNAPEYEGRTLVVVVVSNRGDRPSTITHLGLAHYEARWKAILRKKASHVSWVTIPSLPQPVPFELKPGAEWTGVIDQNAELETMARQGWLYATVFHSHEKKSLRSRIVLKDLDLE